MAEYSGNEAVPGGVIGSGEAQVFNPMPTLQVLGGFQNRADARAKMEALERIKAAQPKKEPEIKYPVLDVAKGGIWGAPAGEEISNIHRQTISQIAPVASNPTAVALLTAEARNRIADINNANEQATKAYFDTAKKLNEEGYVVDPNQKAAVYGSKDWFGKDVASDLYKTTISNPETYNYAMLGDLAASKAKTKTVKVRKADGKEHDEEVPVFANYNPKSGKLEIKAKDALGYMEQIPSIRNQIPFVYKQLLAQDKLDPSIIDKPFEQLTDTEKATILKYQPKVVDRYLGGRLGYKVTDDFETTKQKELNKAAGVKLADIEEVDTPVKVNYRIAYKDGTTTTLPINWGMGKSVRLKQATEIGSNRRAFILGADEKTLSNLETNGLIDPQPDGSYILNFGFKTKEFQKPKEVLQLTEDTNFRQKDGSVKVRPKGAFISPTEAQGLRKMGWDRKFKKVKTGYRISPGTVQVDEDTERRVGPIFQGLDLFFPGGAGELPELENVNPRKKPVVETEEIDIGL